MQGIHIMSDESPRDCHRQSVNPPVPDPAFFGTVAMLNLDALRAVFPAWHISGSPGYYFAARGGVEAPDGPRSLLRRYLSASTLLELTEFLCLQAHLDGLSDTKLAAVWQGAELPRPSE